MNNPGMLKAWLSAARLRTLPLSISGIIVGSAYSYFYSFSAIRETTFAQNVTHSRILLITGLALLTTLGFQVLSNFANDYGDGVKGTDNDQRLGPQRAIQSGVITAAQMKKAVIITSILSFLSALLLILVSFSLQQVLPILFFMILGIAAIWAAIKYTVGDNAYGYSGLGDLFVFIFFGPVSVLGVFYLVTNSFFISLILPSITVGLLSVAVLNLNNMRDIANDKVSGKNTIVVKVGLPKAKVFHYVIVIIAILATIGLQILLFLALNANEANTHFSTLGLLIFLPLLASIPLILHLIRVKRTNSAVLLDPELKKVALSTFLYAILTAISVTLIT
jgi:1,4-dihydroxy-2-naphthoate octaprenyltransferase